VIEKNASLQAHSQSRSAAVDVIDVTLSWRQGQALMLAYHLRGRMNRLRIPPARAPRRADRLWEHTCCELFVAAKGSSAYYEFNFSPSSEWSVYAFRGYRDGGPAEGEELAPSISVSSAADRLELDATIHLDRLPVIRPGEPLRLGLSAVIEAGDGTLSYWALKHPAEKPDFHHSDSFALELALSRHGM
jgi:hypothetical protein